MDFAREIPSAEGVLKALGLQAGRPATSNVLSDFVLFGAGMLVGAGIALLLTPMSGHEMRGEIDQLAKDLRDKLRTEREEAATSEREPGSAPH